MNFARFDIVLIVCLSLAVIMMSLSMPALGLTDESDETSEDEIPELNLSTDQFNFAGEFPNRPGTPSTEYLRWNDEDPDTEVNDRELGDDYKITLTEVSSVSGQGEFWTLNVTLFHIPSNSVNGTVQFSNATNTTVGSITDGDWEIAVELEDTRGSEPGDFFAETSFRALSAPSSSSDGLLAGLPVVGTLFSVGSSVASAVGWIGSVLWWGISWFFEIAATLLSILFQVMSYAISMMHWLISTYTSVVSAAPSFASVIVAVPGILLFLEFAKLGMIALSLLPTT